MPSRRGPGARRSGVLAALVIPTLIGLLGGLGLALSLAWRATVPLVRPGCPPTPSPALGAIAAPDTITLTTHDGRKLTGWHTPSQNGAAVIALGGLHGALGERLPPAAPLIEAGYGVIELDTRACAEPPAPVTLGAREALDALRALAFLKSVPDVDPERIGVIGFSMGGAAAIGAAARSSEISAVVAEGNFYNLGRDIVDADRPLPATQRALLYLVAGSFWIQTGVNPWQISPVDDLPRISPRPVLLIHGEHELESGRALAQFAAAREPKALWIVPGGDHGTNYANDPQAYGERVVGFFDEAMPPAP